MEQSLFCTIAEAAKELKKEADRVANGKQVIETITCGDLQNILYVVQSSTERLKKVVMAGEKPFNHYLADASFVEAVEAVLRHPDKHKHKAA
jgi:hypothetical protein